MIYNLIIFDFFFDFLIFIMQHLDISDILIVWLLRVQLSSVMSMNWKFEKLYWIILGIIWID